MQKFDQLNDVKNQLSTASKVLIALPAQFSTDELAAGLSLYLSLELAHKEVTIVTEGPVKVSDSSLFGVGQVTKTLPPIGGGNLVLSLEGVVAADGSVPALEKLDYFPEGSNLNLVFVVKPGEKFEPARITPKFQGSGFNMIITVGATNLNQLGGVYANNSQIFSGITVVNIDNDQNNSQFGTINLVDPGCATVSEMVAQILSTLGTPMDQDIASNILIGIYTATANLSSNVKPDTFIAVGYAMQAGGKLPVAQGAPIQSQQPVPVISQAPINSVPAQPAPAQPQQNIPFNQIFGFPVQGGGAAEEVPQGEQAFSSNPEVQNPDPDWLTPKIFKGTNIG